MSTLGALLQRVGAISSEQLEEAIDSRILNGGRIGTNLVELGHLSEGRLADGLRQLHGLPARHGDLSPTPEALALLQPEWCDRYNVMPLALVDGKLELGVVDPFSLLQLEMLNGKLGRRVSQVLLPEFRMNQLLRRHAKAFRAVRPVDLVYADGHAAEQKEEEKQERVAAELMSEEEFQSLYAKALTGGRTTSLELAEKEAAAGAERAASEPPPLEGELLLGEVLAVDPAAEEALEGELVVGEVLPEEPLLEGTVLEPASEAQPAAAPVAPVARPPTRPTPKAAARPPTAKAAAAAGPASPPVEKKRVRLSFADAQAALAGVEDRDGIARIVMQFAGSKFRRALLLTVHGNMLVGWEGVGAYLEGARARRIALPLVKDGPFKLVRESRSHFLGPMRRDAHVAGFFKQLGGAPQTSLLMPILAKGRVVNVLYCDSGPDRPTVPDVGELLILAQRVGRSYEAMLLAHRAKAAAK